MRKRCLFRDEVIMGARGYLMMCPDKAESEMRNLE